MAPKKHLRKNVNTSIEGTIKINKEEGKWNFKFSWFNGTLILSKISLYLNDGRSTELTLLSTEPIFIYNRFLIWLTSISLRTTTTTRGLLSPDVYSTVWGHSQVNSSTGLINCLMKQGEGQFRYKWKEHKILCNILYRKTKKNTYYVFTELAPSLNIIFLPKLIR